MTDVATRDVSRYAAGTGWVVARFGLLVALPTATADQAVATWDATADAHGVMEALQAVGSAFDTSLAALPPFAVVVSSGRRAHVLVRGDVEVTLTGPDGETVLHGRDVTTWVERTAERVDGVRVVLGGRASSAAVLPTLGGVLRASVVERGASTSAGRTEPAAAEPGTGAGPATAAQDAAPGLVTAVPGAALAKAADATPAPEPGTVAPEETLTPEATTTGTGLGTGGAGGAGAADDVSPAGGPHAAGAVADVLAAASAASSAGAEAVDDYGALWETTILGRSVEDAAVRPEEEADDEAPEAGTPAAAPMIAVPSEWPAGAPATPGPVPLPVPLPAPDGVDHDGQTVLSSSLDDLREVAAAAMAAARAAEVATEAVATGPQIVARLCPSGHANPPSRETCAVCGAPVQGDARQVARPPLGRVRVSTGQVLDLDRPLVVGRRPRSPRGAGPVGAPDGGAPHRIVTVPSPEQDISRSHVEVRLEGWHVLAVDLHTTNGTTLLRPGQPPLRLHPGEPVLVVSGDVVDLGDGARLAFEDLP